MGKSREVKRLTAAQESFLKEYYLYLTDAELGEVLGRSPPNIRKHRQLRGLYRRGVKVKDLLKDKKIFVWMPRSAFKDAEKLDIKNLLQEKI
jgi:hypothetical protein